MLGLHCHKLWLTANSFYLHQTGLTVTNAEMQVEKRYNYTTPKTFLELIKLYKSVLARKRNQVQEAIDRLDTVSSQRTMHGNCLLQHVDCKLPLSKLFGKAMCLVFLQHVLLVSILLLHSLLVSAHCVEV